MHRYYFHAENSQPFHDEEGTLLENDDAARIEAAKVMAQLIDERPWAVWRDDCFQVSVTDEWGALLFLLDLSAINAPAAHPMPR